MTGSSAESKDDVIRAAAKAAGHVLTNSTGQQTVYIPCFIDLNMHASGAKTMETFLAAVNEAFYEGLGHLEADILRTIRPDPIQYVSALLNNHLNHVITYESPTREIELSTLPPVSAVKSTAYADYLKKATQVVDSHNKWMYAAVGAKAFKIVPVIVIKSFDTLHSPYVKDHGSQLMAFIKSLRQQTSSDDCIIGLVSEIGLARRILASCKCLCSIYTVYIYIYILT
jgi:hypothetical protein